MRTAIVITVGLLLLSVAVTSTPAGGQGTDPAADVVRTGWVSGGGTALATAGALATASAERRGRILALPGLESIGVPLLVAVGGLLGLLTVGGALLFRRRSGSDDHRRPPGDATDHGEGDGVPATTPPSTGGETPPIRTDEEYVLQLLIANHGRMKQARIVEETEWSKAKVSRLLSRMEERDQVVRERDGREKVVQLADANTSIPL